MGLLPQQKWVCLKRDAMVTSSLEEAGLWPELFEVALKEQEIGEVTFFSALVFFHCSTTNMCYILLCNRRRG